MFDNYGIDAVDAWHLKRWGNFTSSENYKLIKQGINAPFDATGLQYIEKKVIESVTFLQERPELESVKSLLHGKAHEYAAYQHYCELTKNYGAVFYGTENPFFIIDPSLPNDAGGSPDVLIYGSNESVEVVIETKCPKDPANQYKRLKWKDQWDVKAGYISAYVQIQDLMLMSGAQLGQFVSYDDRMRKEAHKMVLIDIKPDLNVQTALRIKKRTAVELRDKLISELP